MVKPGYVPGRLCGPRPSRIPISGSGPSRTLTGTIVGLGALTLAILAGCSESTLSVGHELRFGLSSNSPVPVGDSVIFRYDVAGTSLSGMVIDFGDSSADSLSFHGAQTATGRVAHRYGRSGSFPVSATVTDAIQGARTETPSVQVDP